MRSLGIEASMDDLEMVFAFLDRNKDNFISKEEFLELDIQRQEKTLSTDLGQTLLLISKKIEEQFASF